MDAAPSLVEIADALAGAQLEAILIGNAGAALQGAPVTTIDFDFFYRSSSASAKKLRRVAELLGGEIGQPFPEVSSLFRILRQDQQLQVDLVSQVHGVKSFNSLRSRASKVEIQGRSILIASLADIESSKVPSKRSKKMRPTKRELELEALRAASEKDLRDMIRRQLALPMNQRTHFLRMRLPNGGSCL